MAPRSASTSPSNGGALSTRWWPWSTTCSSSPRSRPARSGPGAVRRRSPRSRRQRWGPAMDRPTKRAADRGLDRRGGRVALLPPADESPAEPAPERDPPDARRSAPRLGGGTPSARLALPTVEDSGEGVPPDSVEGVRALLARRRRSLQRGLGPGPHARQPNRRVDGWSDPGRQDVVSGARFAAVLPSRAGRASLD